MTSNADPQNGNPDGPSAVPNIKPPSRTDCGRRLSFRMPLNTFTVACSTTPTVIGTFFQHYLNFKDIRDNHPAKKQLSYHEGVNLIRQFLSLVPY